MPERETVRREVWCVREGDGDLVYDEWGALPLMHSTPEDALEAADFSGERVVRATLTLEVER